MVLKGRTIKIALLTAGLAAGGLAVPTQSAWAQSDQAAEQTAQGESSARDDSEDDSSDGSEGGSAEDSGTTDGAGGEDSDGPPQVPEAPEGPPPVEGAEGESALPAGADGEAEQRQLEDFRKVYERYSAEIEDYQSTVDSIVAAEYSQRRSRVNSKYDRRAEQLEAVERRRRLAAIEKFERFLERHPNHPKYTPDAMFRLAELYFEKENDEYLQSDERYQREMERYQAGRRPSPPKSPQKDYTDTISVFSRLVREWPDYRLLDGAYYLLAYTHNQMGNPRKARDLFAELIVKRPKSEFVPEAWIRIGEYHFDRSDNPGEIELAKQAYQQAMKYEDSRFYDKALYKLAWAHYRLDQFEEAIEEFERLVEYSDEQEAKTGQSGSVLRAEAIKYIAVSLAEEDWDLDRSVDEDFALPRIKKYLDEDKAYEREVLTQLVDYLFENERFEVATNVIRYTLDEFPMHRRNPALHEKLIIALMRPPRQLEEAFEERRKLMDVYGPDSDWYARQKQAGHEEAIEYGDNLVRENLIQAATWYHEQAQKTLDKAKVKQDPEILGTARDKYAKAARAYKQFLQRYPNDKDIYRWNFYYAEALYYSAQYERAYRQYRVVRELDLQDNKFQGTAAFNAVKSLEFQLKQLVEAGKLPDSVVPSGDREEARQAAEQQAQGDQDDAGEQRTEQKVAIESRPIPDLVEQYITAMDRFVVLNLDYEKQKALDAKFAFNAAKIFYDFKHFDTARERFEWIVDHYPDREEAYLAGSLILETYRQEKNYEMLAKWATKLEGVLKGEQAEAVREEVKEFKLGAMFKSAEKLFADKEYEKAAKEYQKLVNQAPDHENAPRALNNAAVAYENIKKYESAMKLYERVYRQYPNSPLAGYALYRVGVNSERFFDFDNAIRTYMLFYEKFEDRSPPELEKMGFDIEEKRARSLLNAAVLAENLQRYREAAERYEQYVATYPDREQAPEAQWQAVEAWQKADRKRKMVQAIRDFRENYGDKPERSKRVLEGMMRIAKWYREEGREDDAAEMYNEVLTEFEERELAGGSDSAYYAAKAQFELAERQYKDWKEIKIDGSLSQQKNKLQEKIKVQKEVQKEFKKVFAYQNLEWTLASGYRLGSLFQGFAESLYNVPIPFEPGTPQYDTYMRRLEQIAFELEDKAIARYVKTIEKAREEKIVNKWTKRTLEELNAYRPKEYPLYKEARLARQKRMVTGRSLLTDDPKAKESGGFEEDGGASPGAPGGGSEDEDSSGGNNSPDEQSNQTEGGGSKSGSGQSESPAAQQDNQEEGS